MSDKNFKNDLDQLNKENLAKLNFEEAKDMTIEEAVRKEAEIKAGVKDGDSILDKYIKQNREEVASRKFENTRDLSELRDQKLDDFIASQRQNMDKTKVLDKEQVAAATAIVASEQVVDASEVNEPTTPDKETSLVTEEFDGTIGLGGDEPEKPIYKKKGVWLGVATAVILGGSALGFSLLQGNQNATKTETPAQTTEATTTKEDTSAKDKENLAAFNKAYAAFFTDANQTKLKNSEFGKLSELEQALKSLEGSKYHADAKSKYDRLSKSIAAVNAVNEKFDSPAIVDGEKHKASLKSGVNLDDLSAATLNTGNANLDTLLQAVMAEARSGQGTSGVEQANPATTVATPATDDKSVTVTSPATVPAPSPAPAVSAASIFGITNYDVNSLQRHLSRVPYNFDLIADTNNPAWTFNEGILEKIVATSQQRGYISGNNYILEKVNIINGNGYYNMFKPDGTYLFSINAKTGYFVGNARGNADALDY